MTKKFVMKITETLKKEVVIEADSIDEAMDKICALYSDEKITLTNYDDLSMAEIQEAATSLRTATRKKYPRY